ncbi:cryptochrome/photolyase family protein [Bacillus pinisoli]|uniref:cryptochrome/photolyase family protein n=1 Tax=Bacillus pinisoli TaxID=2901866 RepID=UPI001FF19B94|nr:deoxyribodipyrimidine photo-lyase [Bacillus pinisoli]
MKKIIVWFRKDLRLYDHPALWEAAKQGSVIPVFIWSKDEEKEWNDSPTSKWWLHHSLYALKKSLYDKGLNLIIRSGNCKTELSLLIQEMKAEAVFFNERYEPSLYKRDLNLIEYFNTLGIHTKSFSSGLLGHPTDICNQSGEPYKTFTPYYNKLRKEAIPKPYPIPNSLKGSNDLIPSLYIEQLELLPIIKWDEKLHRHWIPGEDWALKQMMKFLDQRVHQYKNGRDFPSQDLTSGLSPYLAAGDISPRVIWKTALDYMEHNKNETHVEAFLRQLCWREFSHYQLFHHPTIQHLPMREPFLQFPWMGSGDLFTRWTKGQTGYPLVDAGMRELWETGTMHNRVRMVTASFLVKHLLVNWTEGANWFQQTLVDFDVANNALGWQWVAGTGFDSAPYFRIFNPVTQSEKFDVDGSYIRKWVPELSKLPAPFIHQPWETSAEILLQSDIVLGESYPYPVVDHRAARERALLAYQTIKK